MATLGRIRKRSGLLLVVIGVGMLAFIGGDFMSSLGAGGGGFMLLYIKGNKKKNFLKKNNKLLNIPFNFSEEGSEIIFDHTK